MITQERLLSTLNYNPETGVFIWVRKASNRTRIGSAAGYDNGRGYLKVKIDGKMYFLHRLAWLYFYGKMPNDQIDHIDGCKTNNAIFNLREVTNGQNKQNSNLKSNNISGMLGVHFDKNRNKYQASITINKKRKFLGRFDTAEEAQSAYLKKKKELHQYSSFFTN